LFHFYIFAALPIAVSPQIRQESDTNLNVDVVSQIVYFTRDLLSHEHPNEPQRILGYSLYLNETITNTLTLLVSKTLAELGGSPFNEVSTGFNVSNLNVPNQHSGAYVYAVVGYNAQGSDMNGTVSSNSVVSDIAIPLCPVNDITATADTNLLLDVITMNVSWHRVGSVCENNLANDPARAHSELRAYRLYRSSANYTQPTLLSERLLSVLMSGDDNYVDSSEAFQLTNFSIVAGDVLWIVLASYDGDALSTGYDIGSFPFAVVDKVVPTGVGSGVNFTSDIDTDTWIVTQNVFFTRASSISETALYGQQTDGYQLWQVSVSGARVSLQSKTLAELGGSAGSSIVNPFILTAISVSSGDKYAVYAYNSDGTALSATSISIVDRAIPLAVPSNISYTTDTNIEYRIVGQTVYFNRASSLLESPDSAAAIQGYRLYMKYSISGTKTLVSEKTLAQLGGSADAPVQNGFELTAQSINSNDTYLVVAFNDDFESLTSIEAAIEEISVSTTLPSNLSLTFDANMVLNVVTQNISFTRAVENTGLYYEVLGYRLYMTSNSSSSRKFLADFTVSSLTSASITVPITDLNTTSYDHYSIYTYNSNGESNSATSIVIDDAALPTCKAYNISLSRDTNLYANNVTQTLNFTRDSTANEITNNAADTLGYHIYLERQNGSGRTLLTSVYLSSLTSSRLVSVDLSSIILAQEDQYDNNYYSIYSFNHDGDSQMSERRVITDISVPRAVGSALRVIGIDSQLNVWNVSFSLAFQRDIEPNEYPRGLDQAHPENIVGYRLYISRSSTLVKVKDLTVAQLGTPSGWPRSVFNVTNVGIQADDFFQLFAYNNDGTAFTGSNLASISDRGLPYAVPSSIQQTTDSNVLPNIVTHEVKFIRAFAIDEFPNSSSNITGYRLYFVYHNLTTRALLQSKSIDDLGGSSGALVSNGFLLINFTFSISHSYYEIRSYNLEEDLESEVYIRQEIDDYALPVAVVTNLQQTNDTNLLVFNVTQNVTFVRDLTSKEYNNNAADIDGYRLYRALANNTEVLVQQIPLVSLLASSNTIVIVNLATTLDDRHRVYSYNRAGVCTSYTEITIVDKAIPTSVVTNVTASLDTNINQGYVSQWVNFTRPALSVETPGDTRDAAGYILYRRLSNGTRIESGHLSVSFLQVFSSRTFFIVADMKVSVGDQYEVVAYNINGLATSSAVSATIADSTFPIYSQPTNLTAVTSDANLAVRLLDLSIQFTRASTANEILDGVVGYEVMKVIKGVRSTIVLVALNGTMGSVVTVHLVATNFTTNYDLIEVAAYNSVATAILVSSSLTMSALDKALPVAVARNVTVTDDSNLAQFVVSQVITFYRDFSREQPGDIRNCLGYKLYQYSSSGAAKALLGTLTLSQMSQYAGNFSVAITIASGDIYVIYTYNTEGLALTGSTALTAIDMIAPGGIPRNLSATEDENLDPFRITLNVTFYRDTSTAEIVVSGYSLFIQSIYGDKRLLQSRTLEELGGSANSSVSNPFRITNVYVQAGDVLSIYSYNSLQVAVIGSSTLSVDSINKMLPTAVAQSISQTVDTNLRGGQLTKVLAFVRGSQQAEVFPAIQGYLFYHIHGEQYNLLRNFSLAECGGSPGAAITGNVSVTDLSVNIGDQFAVFSFIGSNRAAIGIFVAVADKAVPIAVPLSVQASADSNTIEGLVTLLITFERDLANEVLNAPSDAVGYRLYLDYVYTGNQVALAQLGSSVTARFSVQSLQILSATNFRVYSFNNDGASLDFASTSIYDVSSPGVAVTDVTLSEDTNVAVGIVSYTVTFSRSLELEQHYSVLGFQLYLADASAVPKSLVKSLTIAKLGSYSNFTVTNLAVSTTDTLVIFAYNIYATSSLASTPVLVSDRATPIAVASNIVVSDDTEWQNGYVTQNISFTRANSLSEFPASSAQLCLGYKLFLVSKGVRTELASKSLSQLGGSAQNAIASPFSVSRLQATAGDQYQVFSYNQAGRANFGPAQRIVDKAKPNYAPTGVIATADTNFSESKITLTVKFVRASNEMSNDQAVTGYYLYQYSANRTVSSLVGSMLVSQLGGSAGKLVNTGFKVVNQTVNSGNELYVVAFNKFDQSTNVSLPISVVDLAIPVAKATLVNVGQDLDYVRHRVTHSVNFTRDSLDVHFAGYPTYVTGYKLFSCPSSTSSSSACSELKVMTLISLASATQGTFTLDRTAVYGDGQYRVYAFNDNGVSLTSSNALSTGDLAQPKAVLYDQSSATDDTNGLLGYVNLNVSFIRADAEAETSGTVEDTVGYVIRQLNSSGSILTNLGSKTLATLGGSPGSRISNAFTFTNLSVRTGDKFVVYAYNLYFVSVEGNPALPIADTYRPIGVASSHWHTVDTNLLANYISVSVYFQRPSNEDNTVGYILYRNSSSTLSQLQNLTITQLGGSPGTIVTTPFVLVNQAINGVNDTCVIQAYNSLYLASQYSNFSQFQGQKVIMMVHA
jgi:hypothetical protein